MSVMSECDNVLAQLINTIVNHEKQAEDLRVELANNQQFRPFSTFRRMNTSETGFLSDQDFDAFLRFYGYSVFKQDLKRLFPSDNQKSSRITYNDFLNQVLPIANTDLRNNVLQHVDKGNIEVSEPISRDIGRLVAAIYQKEIEYLRTLEVDKKRLLKYDVALIDVAFLCLSDDITPFIIYKSTASFMKHNGFIFGKSEYECLMRRIDKDSKGRVSVTDFKYLLFPFKSLTEASQYLNNHYFESYTPIEGISPIKNLKGSPEKNNNTNHVSRNYQAHILQQNSGGSILKKGKNSSSPIRHLEESSSDVKIPAEKLKSLQPASQVTFNEGRIRDYVSEPSSRQNFYQHHNKNIYHADQYIPSSSRRGFYNQEIEAIQDNLSYQNVPGVNCPEIQTRNPLENRFLDPAYHSYWSYSRQHNTTLSPEYLNKGCYNLKSKMHHSDYYNPNFLEPVSYQNHLRYPENPFRHTDHGHYFQTYYNGLRRNYYDEYYNFVPYKTKLSITKSQSSASRSHNSPAKSYVDHDADHLYSSSYNPQNDGFLNLQQVPEQESPFKKSPHKQRTSSNEPGDLKISNPNDFKFRQSTNSQSKNKSAIIIDSQQPQKNPDSSIDSFLISHPTGDVKPEFHDDVAIQDNRPYKYVIVHS